MTFLYDFYWLFAWNPVRLLRATFSGHFFIPHWHCTPQSFINRNTFAGDIGTFISQHACIASIAYVCISLHVIACHCMTWRKSFAHERISEKSHFVIAWHIMTKWRISACGICITTYTSYIPAWLYDPAGFYATITECTMYPNTSIDTYIGNWEEYLLRKIGMHWPWGG